MTGIEPATPPAASPQNTGFGHSKRRVAVEIALIVGGLLAVAGGAIWAAGAASAWLLPFISTEVDAKIGRMAWASPEFALKRCDNPGPLEYVEKIAQPLLEQLGETPYQFEFQVVDTPEVNAFALPGGFVTVNMGLLDKATSGEEVAAVLAHELQHVLLRHGTKRMVRRMGGFVVMSLMFGGTGIEYPAYLVSELSHLNYDRNEESEADVRGLELMARAQLDPIGMKNFFERMAKEAALTPPALLSTHPDPGDRASRAEAASKRGGPWRTLPAPSGLVCNEP
jgi:predicted Zn-dependent protease